MKICKACRKKIDDKAYAKFFVEGINLIGERLRVK